MSYLIGLYFAGVFLLVGFPFERLSDLFLKVQAIFFSSCSIPFQRLLSSDGHIGQLRIRIHLLL